MTRENRTSSVNRAAVNEILSQQLNYLPIFLQMSCFSCREHGWQFVVKYLFNKPVACVPEQANSEQTKNKWKQNVTEADCVRGSGNARYRAGKLRAIYQLLIA